MGLKRYAAKRDKNEDEIISALRQVGATVQPLSEKGVPDLLVGFRRQTFLMETKQRKGKLTPAQVEWGLLWEGSPRIIVRTVEDALQAIGAID